MSTIDLDDIARLDLKLAVTFLALWRERSVTRAARRLSLSQSAVSAALSRLRETAGDPLFIRAAGTMRPTPRAERMAADMETGVSLLADMLLSRPGFDASRSERRFIVGMSDDFQLAMGPELSRRLADEAPRASIVYRQSNRTTAETMIADGAIDLAVVASWPERSAHAQETVMDGSYACLFDPKACGITGVPTPKAYLDLPHVLVSFSGREGIVDEVLKARNLSRHVQTALTHFAALPAFLVGRRAVATLPTHAAARIATYAPLRMSPVPFDLGRYAVSLVRRRERQGDPESEWLLQLVREVMRETLARSRP